MESLRASLAHPEDTDTYRLTLLFRLSASLPKSTPFSPQDCESLREAVVERVGIQFLCRVFDTASSPPASSELISSTAATVIASIASGIPPGFPFWLAPRQGESPLTHATALTVLSVRLWARGLPLATGAGAGTAEADAAGAVGVCAASAVTAAAVAASLSAGRSTEKKRACAAAAAAASHAINTWCLISLLHPPAVAGSPSPAPAPAPISSSNSSSSGGALSAALVAAGASLLAVCGGALASSAARDLTTAGCSPLKSVLLPGVAATTLSFTPPPLPSCSLAHVPAPIAALVRAPSLCHRLLAVALAASPVPAPNFAATAPEGSHASTLFVSAHIRAAARGLLCGLLYLASGLASDDLTSVPKPRALQSIPVAEGGSVPPQWALLLRLLLLPAPAPVPAPVSAPPSAPAPVPASEPAQASTHEISPQTTVSPLAATLPSLRPLTLAACAALLHVFGPAAFTAPASPPVVEAWKAAHSHLSSSACAPPPPPPLRSVQAALALGAVEAHLAAVSVVTSVRAAARAARRAAKALSKAASASGTPLNTSEDAPFERKARQALGDAWVAAALRGETMGSKGTAGSKGDETDDDDDDDDDGKEGAEALATTALTAAEAAAQQSLAAQEGAASLLSVASDLFSAVLDAATADDHAPPASQSLPSLKQAFAAPIDSIPPSSPQSQAAPASLSWDRAGISSSAVFAGLQSLAQPGVELLAHSHAATKTATKARLALSGAAERARLAGVAATLPERALALARAHPLSAAPLRACLPLMESVAELVASPEALPPSARFEAAAPFAPRAAAAAAVVAQAAGAEAGEAVTEVAKGVQERRVLELLLPMLL